MPISFKGLTVCSLQLSEVTTVSCGVYSTLALKWLKSVLLRKDYNFIFLEIQFTNYLHFIYEQYLPKGRNFDSEEICHVI